MNRKDTICPVCEKYSFEYPDDYDNCPICGWENDGVQRENNDYWGGANILSVNEAKTVYLLLQNEATKNKVSQIIDRYKQRKREIHGQFRDIDHRTAKGEECRRAFDESHSIFITDLNMLSETHR